MKTLEQRFWSKVKKTKTCWLWVGARNKAGYGNLKVANKYVNAHRVSFEFKIGPIKKGNYVCHKCDNPSCVNPKHLFQGKPIENDRDKVKKGRQVRGVTHPNSKLTESQVILILKANGSHQNIANLFNVSRRLVGMIKNKKIWKHIQL